MTIIKSPFQLDTDAGYLDLVGEFEITTESGSRFIAAEFGAEFVSAMFGGLRLDRYAVSAIIGAAAMREIEDEVAESVATGLLSAA